MQNSKINLDDLPIDILRQIPLSIRVAKNEYKLSELPKYVQLLVKKYSSTDTKEQDVDNEAIGIKPEISAYGDFKVFTKINQLAKYVLENYLQIYYYPFDVEFGCKLKKFIQTKDISVQQTQISNEVNQIMNIISDDLNTFVTSKKIDIQKVEDDAGQVFYYTDINLEIDGVSEKLII